MSKDSEPLLFIDTISQINESIHESKGNKVFLNRIDDIKANDSKINNIGQTGSVLTLGQYNKEVI